MIPTPDARTLALEALDTLERRESYADAALHAQLSRHPDLDQRDRAFVAHLVYGVLRWRNQLDAHLARASTRPLRRIRPRVLQILRIGAYQLLHLDRVPERAAVSESVELAKRVGQERAAGFVNAVLRGVAAGRADFPLPEGDAARLALRFGCPEWLVERWIQEHGLTGATALCGAAARIPQTWLRVAGTGNSREQLLAQLCADGLDAAAGHFAPEAVAVGGAGDLRSLAPVTAGAAVVQDQASQLIAHLLAPEPGWRILDACAAPGLKATQLAQLTGARGRVVALDIHPHRVRLVAELANRLGNGQVSAELGDARLYRAPQPFDAVLVDAPCSGLGVLARTPEAKWRRSPHSVAEFPSLQLSLLANLADAVRPGGVLVYATCTTLRAENEEVIAALLASRPDYTLEAPPAGPACWDGLLTGQGLLRTFPDPCSGTGTRALDGFFAARLRRAAVS